MTTAFTNQWLTDLVIALVVNALVFVIVAYPVVFWMSFNSLVRYNETEIEMRRHPLEILLALWAASFPGLMCLMMVVGAATQPARFFMTCSFYGLICAVITILWLRLCLPWRLHLFLVPSIYSYRIGFPPFCGVTFTGSLSDVQCIYVHCLNPSASESVRFYTILLEWSHAKSNVPWLLRTRANNDKGVVVTHISRWRKLEKAKQQAAALEEALHSARQAAPKTDAQTWPPPPRLTEGSQEDSNAV